MFRRLESLPMVYRAIQHLIVLASCKYAFLIKMNPNQLRQCNHDEKGHEFPTDKEGELLNLGPMGKRHVSVVKPI